MCNFLLVAAAVVFVSVAPLANAQSPPAKDGPQNSAIKLSQHLPRIVDNVTPNGEVPEEGTISV